MMWIIYHKNNNYKIYDIIRKALATWFCDKESGKQVRLSCWTLKEIKVL